MFGYILIRRTAVSELFDQIRLQRKEIRRMVDENCKLRIELKKSKKNDHRDARGRFAKAPAEDRPVC